METHRKIEIKKIPLAGFIDMLVDLYNSGVDYANMIVEKGERQDSIWLVNEEDDASQKEQNKMELKETNANIDFNSLI